MEYRKLCNVRLFATIAGVICVVFSSIGYFKVDDLASIIASVEKLFKEATCGRRANNNEAIIANFFREIQFILALEFVFSLFLIYGSVKVSNKNYIIP